MAGSVKGLSEKNKDRDRSTINTHPCSLYCLPVSQPTMLTASSTPKPPHVVLYEHPTPSSSAPSHQATNPSRIHHPTPHQIRPIKNHKRRPPKRPIPHHRRDALKRHAEHTPCQLMVICIRHPQRHPVIARPLSLSARHVAVAVGFDVVMHGYNGLREERE